MVLLFLPCGDEDMPALVAKQKNKIWTVFEDWQQPMMDPGVYVAQTSLCRFGLQNRTSVYWYSTIEFALGNGNHGGALA